MRKLPNRVLGWPSIQDLCAGIPIADNSLHVADINCVMSQPQKACLLSQFFVQFLELAAGMVERPADDSQFVISIDMDLVSKIATRQCLGARGQFGEWSRNSLSDVPAEG